MSELTQRLKAKLFSERRIATHWAGCEESHPHCAIAKLIDEVERLEKKIGENEDEWLDQKAAEGK